MSLYAGGVAHRIDNVIFAVLCKGTCEKFELTEDAARQLRAAFEGMMKRPGAESEVRRLLAIAVALERELESPTAASTLLAILRADPIASLIVSTKILREGAVDETRRFLRSEGREEVLRAPSFATIRKSSWQQPAEDPETPASARLMRRRFEELPILQEAQGSKTRR